MKSLPSVKKKKQIPGSQDEHIFPYGKIVWCSQHLHARERGGGRGKSEWEGIKSTAFMYVRFM